MRRLVCSLFAALTLLGPLVTEVYAQPAEKRIALVIGNANYQAAPLKTPANDAGLIAQTLQAAGFDVVGARDLDQDSLRRAFRDFIDKATSSGPDTVAFVYLSGYGLQLEGENYFAPIDAKIARDTDVASEAIRLSDYIRPLGALKLKASIVVLDAARENPFAKSGSPLASGLALVEPEPGTLIAFNATPGTVVPNSDEAYGAYAKALAEMIRDGGLPLNDLFERVRLRVNETTKGAEIPWNASKLTGTFVFFERTADAPKSEASEQESAAIRTKPIRELGAQQAYVAALDRDSLSAYDEFLAAYPNDPMAKRVRALVAIRREAITWRRSRAVDTPQAYWSYLRRYPRGPHAYDARRRLAALAAAAEPPATFTAIEYDVPPPLEPELVYVDRPVLIFDDPDFGFAPPPPPPVYILSPPPAYFVELEPPPPPVETFLLPIPVFVPVPAYVVAPRYVVPPPNNVIFTNIHNTVVVNNTTNTVVITKPGGQTQTLTPPHDSLASPGRRPRPGAAATATRPTAATLIGPSLPPSIAKRATLRPAPNAPGVSPGMGQRQPDRAAQQPGARPQPLLGQPLPGASGRPLPQMTGKPAPRQPIPGVAPDRAARTSGTPRSGQAERAAAPTAPQPLSKVDNRAVVRGSKPAASIRTQRALHSDRPAMPRTTGPAAHRSLPPAARTAPRPQPRAFSAPVPQRSMAPPPRPQMHAPPPRMQVAPRPQMHAPPPRMQAMPRPQMHAPPPRVQAPPRAPSSSSRACGGPGRPCR